jgi:hypothetical protein
MEEERNKYNVLTRKLERERHSEDLGIDGVVIS